MKHAFSFRNFFLVVAVISSLLLTACGGGGGGGGASAPTQQTSSVKVTIPGSLFPLQATDVRASTSLDKLTLKVIAYKDGKIQNDVKVTDREATSNGTNFEAKVDGLLNVYDYRFKVFHNSTELLSNQVAASEIVNDANIKINIETSYKTIAYDSWLKKNPQNASMSNFKENSKSAGFTKDSDYKKLTLKIGNDEYTADQYKENLIKAAKDETASLPTESTAKINVDKIAVTDKESGNVTYTISYNLDGGSVSKANPTKYDSASATITLNNPTKDGFNFTGWTGSNGNTPQTTVTIPKGSSGNKTFTANWTTISNTVFSISYNLDGGTLAKTNPAQYDAASATITLNNPTKDGFNFTGWTGSNGNTPQTTVTIPKGSSGNKTFTANWTPISYSITYNLDGEILAKANPGNYDITSATITLNNPTKDGFNFTGWSGSNGNTPQTSVTIPKGSSGNKTFTANWTPISYSITYNLDGGTLTEANPANYDITSDTITLNNPTKDGYNFKGWTGSNGDTPQTSVKIQKGSTGNKTYTANWTKKNLLEGSGTANDPFIVASADDLNKLRQINNGSYFKQTKDIDLSDYGSSYDNGNGWLPIPYTDSNNTDIYWYGNYDGNNHKITNLQIERFISNVGLFGRIATDSIISNLNIETSSNGIKALNTIGILAGISHSKKISNCSVKGKIIGFDNDLGGMIGLSYSQNLSNCVGSCTIYVGPSKTVSNPQGKTGGLIGYQLGNSYTITNCSTNTLIESLEELQTVGGMFGCCMGNGLISNCKSTGQVKTTGNISGGFAGIIDSEVSIKSCVSSTTSISVGLIAGGFVGTNRGNIELSISEASSAGRGDVGGFAGSNLGNISKCYATQIALLYSENDSAIIAGGFVGQNYSTISNCYSLGIVTYSLGNSSKFTARTGSFAGHNTTDAIIANCYTLGSSSCSFSGCGGIVGNNDGTIKNCVALGSIVRAYQDVGRIAGENTGTISNCYAISTMTVNDEIPTTNIGTDKINGASVTTSTYQNKNWWLNTLGFSSSIWSYSTTSKRMELTNMPTIE